MKLVLDARFAMEWLMGASGPVVEEFDARFHAGTLELHAPESFVAEAAEALVAAVRGARLTIDDSVTVFANLQDLPIQLHRLRDLAATALDLSLGRGLRAGDAFYVALALRDELPLFTADAKLARAVEDAVEVVAA